MGYYDSVKDSVRENNKNSSGEKGGGNFDTLRESAEKNTTDDEERGDGTPIEVLEEDGLSRDSPSSREKSSDDREQQSSGKSQSGGNPFSSSDSGSDTEGLEEKLDTIIEQNQRMIEILESFGN